MKKILSILIVILVLLVCSIAATTAQDLLTVKPEPYEKVPFESEPGAPEPVSDLSRGNVVPDSTPDLNIANPDHPDYGKVHLPDRDGGTRGTGDYGTIINKHLEILRAINYLEPTRNACKLLYAFLYMFYIDMLRYTNSR